MAANRESLRDLMARMATESAAFSKSARQEREANNAAATEMLRNALGRAGPSPPRM